MKRSTAVIGALTLGLGMALAAPTAANAADKIILVPQDFDPTLSDTRINGHYAVEGTGLHIWTDGSKDVGPDGRNSDKVAEYVATTSDLGDVVEADEPTLEYTNTSNAGVPGFQLVVDLDADGVKDGILVGEPVYNGDWWLADGSAAAKAGAPVVGGGSGSQWYGTLAQWDEAFDGEAVVTAFGFSLGSGVKGDGVLSAINFSGDRYTFAPTIELTDKNACKNDGWTTSTKPVFKNQGECVSSFASTKDKLSNFRR